MSETVDIRSETASRTPVEELSEPLTIGVEAYISEDYVRAERDKLWRKVWQQAGRVEEIPDVVDIASVYCVVGKVIPKRTCRVECSAYRCIVA